MLEADVKDECEGMRAEILAIEKRVRALKERAIGPEMFAGQHGEVIAQSMLAVRHLEDARMRLGKVVQYARDGVSILDR